MNAIHPSNESAVNAARQQLNELYSDRFIDANALNGHNVNVINSHHYGMDNQCPVCLNDPRFPIETNCGHLFCGTFKGLKNMPKGGHNILVASLCVHVKLIPIQSFYR